MKRVLLPSTLRKLEYNAFCKCTGLKAIQLPAGLRAIGKSCFQGSDLRKLVFPASVREICEGAFSECGRLRAVSVEEGCTVDVKSRVGRGVRIERK